LLHKTSKNVSRDTNNRWSAKTSGIIASRIKRYENPNEKVAISDTISRFIKRNIEAKTSGRVIIAGIVERNVTLPATVLNGSFVRRYARNVYSGYPGGCATPLTYAAVTKSPASPPKSVLVLKKSNNGRNTPTVIILPRINFRLIYTMLNP